MVGYRETLRLFEMSAPARRRDTNEFADSSNKSSGPLADPTGSDCADG